MFLFKSSFEAQNVLNMFLFFQKFEPQRSYKHGSYKKKGVRDTDSMRYSR